MSGLPWSRCRLLRLSRGVEQFDDLLAWFHEPEGFAWPVIEFLGDRVEVVLRVDGWVGAFGEVLAQEPVGVLVGAALPRGVRVAEVDGHVQRGADPFVQGEFRSLVPGQRIAQEFGQVLHLVDDGLPGVFGVVPVGQVRQDREPGGALDERADGAFVAAAGDEIALPVARDRPVPDLRGSLRDHDHGFAETGFAALAALGPAGGSPLPHGAFRLLLESRPRPAGRWPGRSSRRSRAYPHYPGSPASAGWLSAPGSNACATRRRSRPTVACPRPPCAVWGV